LRVLLDEQLPLALTKELSGCDARTVKDRGWKGLTNGELMKRAGTEGFDVLLTADQSIEFQQNLALAPLGIVLLVAPSNKLEDLKPLIAESLDQLQKRRLVMRSKSSNLAAGNARRHD